MKLFTATAVLLKSIILITLNKCSKMKTYLLGLIFSVMVLGGACGQTLDWAKGINGDNYHINNSIVVDFSGNVYTTGYFQGTVDLDPSVNTFNLTSYGNYDIFISKLNASGNFEWAIQFGGANDDRGSSIDFDTYGNIYCVGYFSETVDFNPGNGFYNLTSVGFSDIFISKLDALGNFVYAKAIGGASSDVGKSITLDDYGNVYTTGYFGGTVDFNPDSLVNFNLISSGGYGGDIFISKLDSLGNFVWAKKMGGTSYDIGYTIAVDSFSNVYTFNYFEGTADFDPSAGTFNLTSSGGSDYCISKLDVMGNLKWAKQLELPSNEQAVKLAIDEFGNVYTVGNFMGTIDFDPGIGEHFMTGTHQNIFILKLDTNGNFIWAKNIKSDYYEVVGSIAIDKFNNVYTSGHFEGLADFDPGTSTFNMSPNGSGDAFITKFNSFGNFIWAISMGGLDNTYGKALDVDISGNVYLTGDLGNTVDLDPSNGIFILNSTNSYSLYILKLKQKGINGYVFNDFNQNCLRDSFEIGIQNRFVTINPGNIIAQTNESGIWVIDSLQIGTYTATLDTSGNWSPTCPVTQTFSVTNPNEITYVPDFGLVSTQPCASPDVSVNMPFMRPCFSNQKVYVYACNQYIATGALNSAYADVELDSLIIPQSASLAYTSLGNNIYRFQLGNLNPGQCKNFTIDCHVSCDALLGQTLCVEANLYPADSCVFDTIPEPYPGDFTPCTLPWDKSSLQVEGYCLNDSIYFVITNTGDFGGGDMDCFSPVRIYIDGVYTTLDSVKLVGGDSIVYVFAGDGRTWRLEADQHPLHPGNSHPNATVEACGNLSNWTPDLVNVLPPNDADPIVDIYCGVVTGSYDPNDKTGYPTGLAYNHYIMPNQQLQYVIRFQNTGTDTAFTVVVRDTLDMDLDIFSVVQGVASHNYNFQMYGPRVLEWTFYNIQLPDSNSNEAGSHGFCTFTVEQNQDLVNNTKITNSADIYFDYNAPITTNQTLHTVNDQVQTTVVTNVIQHGNKVMEVFIYPNPASNEVFIEANFKPQTSNFKLFSIDGKKVLEGKLEGTKTRISTKDLESGVYFIEVQIGNEKMTNKLVITK